VSAAEQLHTGSGGQLYVHPGHAMACVVTPTTPIAEDRRTNSRRHCGLRDFEARDATKQSQYAPDRKVDADGRHF
jgi:hypothetical protein